MIVGQQLRFRALRADKSQLLGLEINRLNGPPPVLNMSAEMSDGIENMTRLDTGCDDFGQERLEEKIVFTADQDDLDRIISFEEAAEPACGLNAGKPAPDNDDFDRGGRPGG